MLKLLSPIELQEHFNAGRFKTEQTLILTGLGMSFNCPPEYVVVVDKVDVGSCWQSDIEYVLKNIDPLVDTYKLNPNLPVFQVALERMKTLRKNVMDRKAAFAATAQIIPLFGHR